MVEPNLETTTAPVPSNKLPSPQVASFWGKLKQPEPRRIITIPGHFTASGKWISTTTRSIVDKGKSSKSKNKSAASIKPKSKCSNWKSVNALKTKQERKDFGSALIAAKFADIKSFNK